MWPAGVVTSHETGMMQSVATIENLDGIHVVTVHGEIDAFTAPSLRDVLHHLITGEHARLVVADLTAVTFLDSSGLGAILGALRRLREQEGRLLIVQPETAARRIFELTGLDSVLELYDDRDAAIGAATA